MAERSARVSSRVFSLCRFIRSWVSSSCCIAEASLKVRAIRVSRASMDDGVRLRPRLPFPALRASRYLLIARDSRLPWARAALCAELMPRALAGALFTALLTAFLADFLTVFLAADLVAAAGIVHFLCRGHITLDPVS